MAVYPKQVLDALSHVRYPGTGKDIVSSGMVGNNIRIDGNVVSFSIEFDKKSDPFTKSVIKAAEQAVLTYVGEDIEIKGNISIVVKEAERINEVAVLPGVKNVIAISSGKGGVGKSTISVNLAVALASLGYRVGLLDADIHGPSIPKMFGVEEERIALEEIEGKQYMMPLEKYGVKFLSIGFFVNPDEALVWRGSMAGNALKQLIIDAYWGELDYFLIDMPPGTSDIHLTLVQTLRIAGVIIVTTPQEVALADARKGINMFKNEKISIPILGLIENMSWFTPLELPDSKYYIFGKEGGKKTAIKYGIDFFGEIPLVQSVGGSGDSGIPVFLDKNNIISLEFKKMAQKLINKLDS